MPSVGTVSLPTLPFDASHRADGVSHLDLFLKNIPLTKSAMGPELSEALYRWKCRTSHEPWAPLWYVAISEGWDIATLLVNSYSSNRGTYMMYCLTRLDRSGWPLQNFSLSLSSLNWCHSSHLGVTETVVIEVLGPFFRGLEKGLHSPFF